MIRGLGGLLASRLGLLAGTGLGLGSGHTWSEQLEITLHKMMTWLVLITEGSRNDECEDKCEDQRYQCCDQEEVCVSDGSD